MTDPYVSLNGEIVPRSQAHISCSDRGLLLGDGLFETMRIYDGDVFRLPDHLERLKEGCGLLRISPTLTDQVIGDTIRNLLEANNRSEGALRLTLTRGQNQPALDPQPGGTPTVLVTCTDNRTTLQDHCRVVSVAARRDEDSPLSGVKSINYLPNILARFEVKDKNADEGLLLNVSGAIAEGTVSNVFWIRGGIVFTPSVACGVLPGVTRRVVLDILADHEIPVAEGAFGRDTILGADAVFLTNSLIEIASVSSIDETHYPDEPHPTIALIRSALQQLTHSDSGASDTRSN